MSEIFEKEQKNISEESQLCVKIFGVGGAGASMVCAFNLGNAPIKRFALDTTLSDLRLLSLDEKNKILLGESVTHGIGAGTQAEVGEKAAAASDAEIRNALAGTNLLFLVTALGRGTGCGASTYIAKIAHELGITTVCFATNPLNWEGTAMTTQAANAADKLRESCNAFILVEKDLIAQQSGDIRVEDAFKMAQGWIEKGIEACCSMLFTSAAGLRLDFATFRCVFPLAGTKTLFALGTGTGQSASEDALRELFHCQLLQTSNATSHSDTLAVHLRLSSQPSMAFVNDVLQRIQDRFGGDERTLSSFTVVPEMGDRFEICVIGAGNVKETRRKQGHIVAKPRKNAGASAKSQNLFSGEGSGLGGGEVPLEQGELFDSNRGVFQTQRTRLYDGVDLDRPTYLRKQCNLDKILERAKKDRRGQ